MNVLMISLLGLALLAVLGSLIAGVFVMTKGGETDKKYSNKLMQARIYLQGLALLLIAIMALAMSGS